MLGLFLIGSLGLPDAFGHGIMDQSFTGPTNVALQIELGVGLLPIGQEFTPTANNLIGVDVILTPNTNAPQATLTVNIREGVIAGPILGTTTQIKNMPGLGNSATVHFDFPSKISLSTCNPICVIEVFATPNNSVAWHADTLNNNPYPSGSAYLNGILSPTRDMTFTTYFEPEVIGGQLLPLDTTALLLAGVQSVSMWMIPVVLSGIGIGIFVITRRN